MSPLSELPFIEVTRPFRLELEELSTREPFERPVPAAAAMQASPRRQMSHEEEEQILKRADELTARVEAILREFDPGR